MPTLQTLNGALVQTLRMMELTVQEKPYNRLVTFHVMDCLTSSNAILG